MNFHDEVIELLKNRAHQIFGVDASTLGAGTRFDEDLHCKSADIVRFSAGLEDEYEVEVPYMALKRCKTFDEVAAYMSQLTGIE